jgi:hypothetical protein
MTRRKTFRSVAALGLAVAFALAGGAVGATVAGACSMAPPTATIVGSLVAKDGGSVRYRIEQLMEVQQDQGFDHRDTLTVTYVDGDARYLEVGTRYRVSVYASSDEGPPYYSGVKRAEEDCGGGGTVFADGSAIDTGLTLLGIRVWPTAAAAAVLGALAVALVARTVRHRRNRPTEVVT